LSASAAPVDRDVACRKCGYNLRGLTTDGRCPECGTAVGFSLQGDLLRFCDPRWVETLRRGAGAFVAAVVIFFVVWMSFLFSMRFEVFREVSDFLGYATIGGYVLALVGWWLMTQADPSGLGEDVYGTARKVIRVTLAIALIELVVRLVIFRLLMSGDVWLAFQGFEAAGRGAMVVSFAAQLAYLKRLAVRIPDHKLSRRAGFLMYALSSTLGLYSAIGLITVLTRAGPMVLRGSATACCGLILGLCLLVFGTMYLLLVEKMGKRFKEQATAARLTWAAVEFSRAAPAE
jgi:hypothetical protein